MIINYNSTAVNAYNSLTKNTAATTKSIQQLSSGKRINSASDDPAGSAISTLMQNQINGLSQAKMNASSGNDLLQTGADALSNIQNILAEMKTKATQAASDNNTDADRTKLQSQVDSLSQGISDITNTTEFNTQNLLAGGLSDTFQVGANSNQSVKVSISAMDAQSLGVASYRTVATGVTANTTGMSMTSTGRGLAASAAKGYSVSVQAVAATVSSAVTSILKTNGTSNTLSVTSASASGFTGTVDTDFEVKVASVNNTSVASTAATPVTTVTSKVASISYSTDGGASWQTVNGDFTAGVKVDGVTLKLAAATNSSATSNAYTAGDQYNFSMKASHDTLQLQGQLTAGTSTLSNIGAAVDVHSGDTTATVGDSTTGQTVGLQFDYSGTTKALSGLPAAASQTSHLTFAVKHDDSAAAVVVNGKVTTNAQVAAGIDISTQASANAAIKTIDDATAKVSEQYAQIGAYQDRLSYTQDNLTSENTNLSTAQSDIQNVDIAQATTEYQKNNILQQAATSMLAKANQLPQTALTLLQG